MNRMMIGCLLALALVFPACAFVDSGNDVPGAIYNLAGEWTGWFEDDAGADHDFTMVLNYTGTVTQFYIDDVLQGYTGVVNQNTAEGFQILFSAGGGAVMVVDPAVRHCVYFDANGGFGVLQKSVPASWSYLFGDPAGNWSGFAYIYNAGAGGFFRYSPWTMTIADDVTELPFAGVDDLDNVFGGGITGFDAYYGWYIGSINVPYAFPPDIVGGLSPDKQFFGAYVGDIGVDAWPEDYWFLMMTRQ